MEWEAFLNHPKVIEDARIHLSQPVDEYLYKKLLHDMLECLTGYEGFVKIGSSVGEIPINVQDWLSKWSPSVESWISSLTILSNRYAQQNVQPINADLRQLITGLPNVVSGVSQQYDEAQKLAIPAEGTSGNLLREALSSIARLNRICYHIQNQQYLHLWNSEY